MAYSFTTNQTPATAPVAVYTLFARLITAGWTKVKDSDGTTYSSSGTQVTSGAAGTNGLGNNSAWVNLRAPSGTRELVFQRGTSDTQWRITYSPTAFNSGSPAATVVPSSANSGIVLGGGTDASPTFSTWFTTNNTYKEQVGADSASPYGFFMVTYPNGGGNPSSAIIFDPLLNAAPEDTDQVIIHIGISSSSALLSGGLGSTSTASNVTRCCGWIGFGLGGSFVTVPTCTINSGGTQLAPNGLPSNFHNGKDDGMPVLYARASSLATPNGYKGMSSVMYFLGTTRSTPNTLNSLARLVVGDVSLPWDGSTTPTT